MTKSSTIESRIDRKKPAIVVAAPEHDRLMALAAAAERSMPDVSRELQDEMARARVVAPERLAPDIVRMGSRVAYRSDDGKEREVTLVYPFEADIAQQRVSIMTPIGAALIGLSPGQWMGWTARDGRRHRLTVIAVTQPETAI